MSWIRRECIGSFFASVLVLAITSTFLLNGIIHAMVPHVHAAGSEVITQNMHAALKNEQKIVVFTTALLLVVGILIAAHAIAPSSHIAEYSPLQQQLHRGIFKYRRFR